MRRLGISVVAREVAADNASELGFASVTVGLVVVSFERTAIVVRLDISNPVKDANNVVKVGVSVCSLAGAGLSGPRLTTWIVLVTTTASVTCCATEEITSVEYDNITAGSVCTMVTSTCPAVGLAGEKVDPT